MDKRAANVKKPSVAKEDLDRQARLAEALRANLRRRKAQARAQEDGTPKETTIPKGPAQDD